jgi:hypothetical protein
MTIEFKAPMSALPDYIAPHTFGVFSTGKFIHLGRHEVVSEVWTAPSRIGQAGAKEVALGKDGSDVWREKMVCLGIASQMALTIPLEVNARKANKKTPTKL